MILKPDDFYSLSKEEKIAILNKKINAELCKSADECDCDLIDECVDFINQLDNVNVAVSEDEVESFSKHMAELYREQKPHKPSFKGKIKKTLLFSAIITVITAGSMLTVSSSDSIYFADNRDALDARLAEINSMKLEPEVEYDFGSISVMTTERARCYHDLNYFIQKEKCTGICYPEYLPGGVEFRDISIAMFNGVLNIRISFNTRPEYTIAIRSENTFGLYDTEYVRSIFMDSGMEVHYFEDEESGCQFEWKYLGWHYSITSNSFYEGAKIINSMKEIM